MIDMNHKYQTRDGRAVRILCVDGANDLHPVVGFIDGQVWTFTWRADGAIAERANGRVGNADLIPVPTKHEGWIVVDDCEPNHIWQQRMKDTPESVHRERATRVAHVTWED